MSDTPAVLLTGASRGIGAATALEFARRGHDLVLVATDAAALQNVAREVERFGRSALVLAGDLADLAFVGRLVPATIERFARLDVLVNNAAWREAVTMRQISLESWERTLRICLTTPALLARDAAAHMEQRGRGVIINVSSIMSRHPSGSAAAYVAAKGGIDALSYELAALYGPGGIRVISFSPGAIDTEMSARYSESADDGANRQLRQFSEDMIPLRRWGSSEETARTIAWLASDDASYITGTTIVADGGWSRQLHPYSLKQRMHPGQFK